ncbi:MAG: helix-turn-helix domain-containing protein [Solirubrobacteraceae bacterium]
MSESASDLDGARDRLRAQSPLGGKPDRLLSVDEAAEKLQLSAYTIRQFARQRKIPAIRLGRYWRFRDSSLDAWLCEHERAAR